jgi:hypothetical protein
MTFNANKSDWLTEGYLGFNGTLPPGPDLNEIDEIFFSLDRELQAIHAPPVAELKSSAWALISADPDEINKNRTENYDDQRGFYVEFSDNVSAEQIKQAVDIIKGAFHRIKISHPDAGLSK